MIEVARSRPRQEVEFESASADVFEGPPFCGCLGCTQPAIARIEHAIHGLRTVCASHINGFPIVEEIRS